MRVYVCNAEGVGQFDPSTILLHGHSSQGTLASMEWIFSEDLVHRDIFISMRLRNADLWLTYGFNFPGCCDILLDTQPQRTLGSFGI